MFIYKTSMGILLSCTSKNKIMTIFKMKNNLSHVINSPLTPLPCPVRFSGTILFTISAQSSVEQHHSITLFILFTIKLWNSLPDLIKSSTSLNSYVYQITTGIN